MGTFKNAVLVLYNCFILFLAGVAVTAAAGRDEPLAYIQAALSTPSNRVLVGAIAIVFIALALGVFFNMLKQEPSSNAVTVKNTTAGQIAITIPAVKVLIMKAVRQVEGVREVKPAVYEGNDGLLIKLHMLINPDLNVPELSQNVQNTVKQFLQDIGGLQVAEVRVLVDEFVSSGR